MSSWYTPPAFVPVKYIPSGQRDVIRAKSVLQVHATAYPKTMGPYTGGSTNHWSLFLQTGTQESVCIDPQPNLQQPGTVLQDGYKSDIIVSLLPYSTPSEAIHVATIAVSESLLVGHVVDHLLEHGCDRYEFTVEGVGCRKWLSDTLGSLEGRKWLNEDSVGKARGDIKTLWPDRTPLDLDCGQYY